MPQTKIRGSFPGHRPINYAGHLRVVEAQHIPQKVAANKGKSAYADVIEHLLESAPGSKAVECPNFRSGRSLVHAICRYLKNDGLYEKLRPSVVKHGDSYRVWIVERQHG